MAYSTRDFRGEAQQGIRFKDGDAESLRELFQKRLPAELEAQAIPACIRFDTVKSGGLFGTRLPIMIISHPNPPSRFFDIGVVVNGNIVSFPLLGESKQNTAANMGKRYDEFKLQQEESWRASVVDVIEDSLKADS